MERRKNVLLVIATLLALISGGVLLYLNTRPEEQKETSRPAVETPAPTTEPVAEQKPQVVAFDKAKHSTTEPGSIWWVVNKKRPLPAGYAPDDLVVPAVQLRLGSGDSQMRFRNLAEPALKEMFAAASKDGVSLVFGSGFRSEALQRQFYNSYVASDGQAAADRYSARPGTSEHQTGLSFDATSPSKACHLEICFKDTPQGAWLRTNAHKYGFIVRYPDGKESVTGYQYEPWHMRYVGTELASEMKKQGVSTLEEFFDLPAAPSY